METETWQRSASSLLVLLFAALLCARAFADAPLAAVASDTRSLFALLQQPGVQSIRLSSDIVVRAEELPAQRPILLERNVTISGAQDVGAPLPDPSSTILNMTMLDFAFLPALICLAPGTILRFEGIEVWRGIQRAFFFSFISRSPAGQPQRQPQLVDEVMSPPLCWRTVGGAGGAAVHRPTAVAMAVPAASVPAGATCRSPFLKLSNISYLVQFLDTDLDNTGGYVTTYLDSLFACDWPVSDACIAEKGADRCQAEMAAAHERDYDSPPPRDGGPPLLALALGVGLGGGTLALCGLLAAAALLARRRRRCLRGVGDARSNKEAPAGAADGGAAAAGQESSQQGRPASSDGRASAGSNMGPGSAAAAEVGGATSTTGVAATCTALSPQTSRTSATDLFLGESGQVETVRRQLAAGGQVAAVQVLEPIGAGSFARVYRGLWQGRVVALKVMMLHSGIRQQQAQMEAAVSASMNHPSIVQTYSYSFRLVLDSTSIWSRQRESCMQANAPAHAVLEDSSLGCAGDAAPTRPLAADTDPPRSAQPHGYELQLVLEYCDLGSLRGALDLGAFHRRGAEAAGREGPGGDGGEERGAGGRSGDGGRDGRGEAAGHAPAFRYGLMLAVAYDVASALLHLHTHGIVHGDVKTCNVLLTSGSGGRASGAPAAAGAATSRGSIDTAAGCGQSFPLGNRLSDPTGHSSGIGGIGRAWSREEVQQRLTAGPVLAKLADFGLATYVDEREGTHGTLSHVAPELLLHGHISRHVDTYAFGILLHELFTGGRAYSGVPKALLPHQVAVQGLRPVLPPYTPPAFRLLVESCWDASPHARPSIQEVMVALQSMRAAHEAAAAASSGGAGSAAAAAGDWVAVPPAGFKVFAAADLLVSGDGSSAAVASDTRSLFALLQQPGVQSIRLSSDIVMRAEELPAQLPVLLERNVTISGAQDVGAPRPDPSSTILNMTMLDFAFLAALIRLAPGVVLRFEGIEVGAPGRVAAVSRLQVWRTTYRSFSYLTFLARSPGAEVQLVRSIQHRLACLPLAARLANLRSLPRPAGPPPREPQQADEVMSPPLCWRTAGGAGGAAAQRRTAVAMAVPATLVPPGATCRSPFLELSSISYLAQLLDTDLDNTGGYVVTYLDSLFACDWPVSDACIAEKGADRCQAEMTAAHERDYDPPPPGAGGPPLLALALGVGLGGGTLALCGLLAAAALLACCRRRCLRGVGDARSNKEAPAGAAGSGAATAGQDSSQQGRPAFYSPLPLLLAAPLLPRGPMRSNARASAGSNIGTGSAAAPEVGGAAATNGVAATRTALSPQTSTDLLLGESGQVEAVRRQLAAGGQVAAVQVLEPIGAGSFARVYRGLWQGRVVALKVMMLHSGLQQQQAQMEAAVSASINHPSIVQTYSYSFRLVLDSTSTWSQQRESCMQANAPAPAVLEDSSLGGANAAAATRPLAADTDPPRSAQPHGYELQLVLEYCDLGSLRGALDLGAFHRRGTAAAGRGGPEGNGGAEEGAGGRSGGGGRDGRGQAAGQPTAFRYGLMLAVAYDVASALLHLHTHGIVHGDVKACNVLLTSGSGGRASGAPTAGAPTPHGSIGAAPGYGQSLHVGNRLSDPTGQSSDVGGVGRVWSREEVQQRLTAGPVLAKLADFGLATYVDEREGTHGTLSHVAPELLLHGHISRHVDTYAFGILLHELFTGGRAYSGVPKALLPHEVAVQGLRPVLPPYTPPAFRLLVESCWDASPHARPSIQEVMAALQSMRAAHEAEAAASSGGDGSVAAAAADWVAVPPGFEVFGGARCNAAEFQHFTARSSLSTL
ncbi:putative serine/threonine-protein kinase [Tetrabaena socialis]|uniref:Putative serine/threonine-protein kinase n=1 Tax=Tetrabaena socialis TaxID=47790 RepID=A0A2J8AEV7_9CHLO|nr:putative serine/threonine-protein kinase [Tetrabaena socialis]|eukprot:PNH11050.1 putative serine/threonine-protein kinase [Tetrabaena socialis]